MQDDIVIHFTAQHLDIVANALGHRPYIESAPVIEAIRQQVANQPPQLSPGLPPIDPPPADGASLQ
jgi:hypothetical protein